MRRDELSYGALPARGDRGRSRRLKELLAKMGHGAVPAVEVIGK
jgi:hypothetical protein